MISLYTIITIALCHYIFDFKLQTDEMAKGKSTCNNYLTEHVGVYTWGLLFMATLNASFFPPIGFFAFIGLNALLHWLTDFVTSRATSLLWKEGRVHDFFDVIGADQFIHYFCLYSTFVWCTSLN